MVLTESRRAEDGDAGADEVETAEPLHELARDADDPEQLRPAGARGAEEPFVLGVAVAGDPLGRGGTGEG